MVEWFLETAALALSIFVTVSFLWLGLTVLLNGDRRRPVARGPLAAIRATGIVPMATAGLLVGAVFFLSHTMILGRGLIAFGFGMEFWWRLAWTSVVVAPALWCLVILHYADVPPAHRPGYRLAQVGLVLAGIALIATLAVLNPFPSYDTLLRAHPIGAAGLSDIPLAVWLYVPYMAACYLVPLIALPRPTPGRPRFLAAGRVRGWQPLPCCCSWWAWW